MRIRRPARALLLALIALPLLTACQPALPDEGPMPEFDGVSAWLNSAPLTRESLKGKVVLVDFWTYSCINCLRALPHVKEWAAKYRDEGLVVIGVHTPEFDFEHDSANVRTSLTKLGITYPVAMDNDMAVWNAFNNQYWPAHYFVDANGRVRYHKFGEGEYEKSEEVIKQLLRDANQRTVTASAATAPESPAHMAAASDAKDRSPETYIGYARAQRFAATPAAQHDRVTAYQTPSSLSVNDWGLGGNWIIARTYAQTSDGATSITFRFNARDVHLVLKTVDGKPALFRVTLNGAAPGDNAGVDVDAGGNGTITEARMYQLIRQKDGPSTGTFTITFQTPGVQAYAFTFG